MRRLLGFAAGVFSASILCFTWAGSSLAAQADAKPQKPPAPATPVFTLLDNNGAQVGTVISVAGPHILDLIPGFGGFLGVSVVTRVQFQDSTGVTRNLALEASSGRVQSSSGGGVPYFESSNCSGTPFISPSSGFLPAFDSYVLISTGILTIPTSNFPETIVAHSEIEAGSANCQSGISSSLNLLPGEFAGNINDVFPPPYTLTVK